MSLLGFAIFVSAFLLFQLQPLIGKYILPWFGGGPSIWTACLLFFQVVLLMGYSYAHIITSRLSTQIASGLHISLLCLSLLALPIAPSPSWKFTSIGSPSATIFVLLAVTVGLPYFLLSTTTPLLQKWHAAQFPKQSVYRLYALSNAGSLFALLSYPLIFEPLLPLKIQTLSWSVGYTLFVVLGVWTCRRMSCIKPEPEVQIDTKLKVSAPHPNPFTIFLWVAFSAVAAALLIATTNQMCQEIAVVPFLWIAPLTIYLFTFILCFDREEIYRRTFFGILLGVAVPIAIALMVVGLRVDIQYHVIAYGVALFACCMCCNGELVKSKPHPKFLTLFYLSMAVGAVLGGVTVTVLAPLVLSDFSEYSVLLASCGILVLLQWYRLRIWTLYSHKPHWIIAPVAGIGFSIVSAVIVFGGTIDTPSLFTARNFHGVLRLTKEGTGNSGMLHLSNGRVLHGAQFISSDRQAWPTAYYGAKSAAGLALARHPKRLGDGSNALRIGVIGLGVGTIATHATTRDYLRFYEINPEVINIAKKYFTYLKQTPAKVEIVLGDARNQMEAELIRNEPQGFDVLMVDAFTSGAIPIHLLTVECVDIYWKHLRRDGLLLFHITNDSVDLEPVIRGLADLDGVTPLTIVDTGARVRGTSASTWILLTANSGFLQDELILQAAAGTNEHRARLPAWTDSFASLWQVLR